MGVHSSPGTRKGDGSALHPVDFTAGEGAPFYIKQGAGWAPRSGLYVLKKGTVSVACWELNPQFLSCPLCQLKCSGF